MFEKYADSDSRPRAAIEGLRVFAGGSKRTAQLRSLAMSAHAAAREVGHPAAAAAARAAGLAAASAYTHPLVDVQQPSILSVRRPTPPWRRSSTRLAIRPSLTARSAGRLSTLPVKRARSCCTCPPGHRVTAGWMRSCMRWMRVSAAEPCRETPDLRFERTVWKPEPRLCPARPVGGCFRSGRGK